jgi:type II restriction enzyme
VDIVEDVEQLRVRRYDFSPPATYPTETQVDEYIHFLLTSGLLTLLSQVKSIPDYVTGVEVGMDTNTRKNRSGACAIKALRPAVERALEKLPDIDSKAEATCAFLTERTCILPKAYKRKKWDWAFWKRDEPRRFVVVEVNHYGGPGSKPESIAAEYRARQLALNAAGIGFIWVTDGKGWLKMRGALGEIFEGIDFLTNIRLAREGQFEWALRYLLLTDPVNHEELATSLYTSR